MASTYVNDLRLNEMATGDASGSWGTVTNTNLELIGEAFSYGTETIGDADSTLTIADGAADAARSFYLKITSSVDLTTTRIVTLAPNTVSKVWMIENATTGSQVITIKQGSGATINVPNGQVKMISTDGAGSGGAVLDLLVDVDLTGTTTLVNLDVSGTLGVTGVLTATSLDISGDIDVDGTTNLDVVDIDGATQIDATVTVGVDDTGYDVKFFGATAGKSLLWDESADSLIVTGSTSLQGGLEVGVDDTGYDVKFFGATAGKYMLWDESADTLEVSGTVVAGAGTALLPSITTTGDLNTGMWFPAADTIAFSEGGVEALRIDSSGNVGIGTSSPSDYYSDNLVVSAPTENGITIAAQATTNTNYLMFADGTSGDARYRGYIGYLHANDSLVFGTSGAERMRIDSSGNVGIGVVPDAWSGTGAAIQLEGTGHLATANQYAYIGSNYYYNGGWKYTTSSTAAQYRQDSGTHQWLTAASGSADAAITWSESMRIDSSGGLITTPAAGGHAVFNEGGVDADFRVESDTDANALFVEGSSGNVGIGTSSPTRKLSISSTGQTDLSIRSADNSYAQLLFGDATEDNAGAVSYDNATNTMYFHTVTAGLDGRHMTIDSSGGLITNPAAGGHAVFNEAGVDADFRVESDSNANMLFLDASVDRISMGTR
jgi:hypothetical protein